VAATWREAWRLLDTVRRDRDVVLTEHLEGVDSKLRMDRFRMVQLFRNMFENSLAACPDPVVLRMACREVELEEEPALEVRVCDNGPGLAPEARGNVFEPFFTTKTKGTGLGMAIARRIIEAHGGRIEVGDRHDHGAEFVITIPRNSR
jgi:signal transduction histidine kinase